MVAVKTSEAYLVGVVDPKIDIIAADTTTDIPAVLGTPADTDLATDIANIQTNATMLGGIVERTTSNIAQTGSLALFTVTGEIQILSLRGEVTTAIQAQANDTKLIANSTAGTDTDICAVSDTISASIGSILSLSGTFANPLIITPGNGAGATGAFESQANPINVTAGTIDMSCGANNTGQVQWTLVWKPVSSTGSVVAA